MTLVLRLYRHCRGSFTGWSDFLALLDNNIGTRMPFIQMGSISNLQHHVPNRTGFISQSHFWLDSLRTPLPSHITVIHILSGSTFSLLSLILTCHHIFFNRRHRGSSTTGIHLTSTTMFLILFISTSLIRDLTSHYFSLFAEP